MCIENVSSVCVHCVLPDVQTVASCHICAGDGTQALGKSGSALNHKPFLHSHVIIFFVSKEKMHKIGSFGIIYNIKQLAPGLSCLVIEL